MVQIDHLLLKILPLVPKQSEQVTHPRSEIFFGVLKDLWHTLAQLGRALREHQAALQQEGTQLVDHGRSSCDQTVAHTMQRLQIELVICLDRHETHVLSSDSLRDSFCIKEVIFVGLHKWPHELRPESASRHGPVHAENDQESALRHMPPGRSAWSAGSL